VTRPAGTVSRARPSRGATCWRRSRVRPQAEEDERTEQRQHVRAQKAERRHALAVDDDRPMHAIHGLFGHGNVVAESLDTGTRRDDPRC